MQYCISNVLDKYLKGWLAVQLIDGTDIKLCYNTIIQPEFSGYSSPTFRICEGVFDSCDAKFKNKDDYYKIKSTKINKGAELTLSLRENKLEIRGLGVFTVILGSIPLSLGNYDVMLPAYIHYKTPKLYLNEEVGGSRFSETWFELRSHINTKRGYFLHFGRYSEGCITVPFTKDSNSGFVWNKIYYFLLNARLKYSVLGKLSVT